MTTENKLTIGAVIFALIWIVTISLLHNSMERENDRLRGEIAGTKAKIAEIEKMAEQEGME